MVFTIRAAIEVLGYPESHVNEVIKKIIEKLKSEEGINVLKENISATEKVKEKFFASFIDVEMKLNDTNKLLNFCYEYLPSSLEILDTEKVVIPVREFTSAMNEMLAKLHHYNIVMNNLSMKLQEEKNKTN